MDVSLLVASLVAGFFFIMAFAVARALGGGGGRGGAGEQADAAPGPDGDDNKAKTKQVEQKSSDAPRKAKFGQHHGKQPDKFSHPWLLTSLKGHSGRVLDMDLSENGKYLASCAEDRSVLVWHLKDFAAREHKSHRGNVAYDHATKVRWSPDSRAYIVQKAAANVAEVYKIGRREDGGLGPVEVAVTFPCQHETDVIGIGFSPTAQYVMTCSDKTSLVIWSIRGEVLAQADTYHMSTYCAKVSPCGRFVATSGFTPDVKLWEVKFLRTGEFDKLHRAFELTGHSSGVFSFDFSADSSRVATVGKDGTWRLFKVDVEFERGQDPEQLQMGSIVSADQQSQVALSPDAEVVAVSQGSGISLFSTKSGDTVGHLQAVHSQGITRMLFDREGRWLLTAGDKHIRVFHNVAGHKAKINAMKSKLRTANTEGMKQRLTEQLKELEDKLKGIGV